MRWILLVVLSALLGIYGGIVYSQAAFVAVPSGIGIRAVDKIALDDVIPNINIWLKDALVGRIDKARDDMIAREYPNLLSDPGVLSVPRSKDDLIALIASRSWYKNRAQRDSIEAASRPR